MRNELQEEVVVVPRGTETLFEGVEHPTLLHAITLKSYVLPEGTGYEKEVPVPPLT